MSERGLVEKRIFTYSEASALLPEVRQLTEQAYQRVEELSAGTAGGARVEIEAVVDTWAREVVARGAEIKGLWLVDFDNGSGYYCWRHPEPGLRYYHSYEDGIRGRVPIQ
jgi:hypothetical protein